MTKGLEPPRACLPSDAEVYLDRHKWTEARDCYLDIIKREDLKRETSDPAVWMGLATSLTYLGHREEALKQLINAAGHFKGAQKAQLVSRIRVLSRLFLTNTTFQVYQDGLILLSSRKFKLSQEKFERALSKEIDNVEVLIRMGQSAFFEGNSKEAVGHFKMAKRLDPYDPEIRMWLGKAFQTLGNSPEALLELKEAYHAYRGSGRSLEKDAGRNSEVVAVWYADSLASSGQISAALKILTQDSKSNSSHLFSLVAAAKLRTQASRFDPSSWSLARKDLNLALKRLEHAKFSDSASSSQIQDNLAFVQDKSPEEIKTEILGYLKQLEHKSKDVPLKQG